MNYHAAYFTKLIFFAGCLALGCSSGDGASAPTVDTQLLGIYQLDR